MARQTKQKEPQGPIEGVPVVELKNHASNETVTDRIREEWMPLMERARNNRRAKVEDDWDRYRDVYALRRSQAYYEGRSKLFLPVLKKSIDTLVRIAKDSIMSDPYISVESEIPDWKEIGVAFHKRLLEDQGRIREVVPMFLRQLYTIGTSCIKYNWKEVSRQVRYREKDSSGFRTKKRKMYECYGPSLEVVDMKHVYVWPFTATCYQNLDMVFEDSTAKISKLEAMAKRGFYSNAAVEEVKANKVKQLEDEKAANSQPAKEVGNQFFLDDETVDITDLWIRMRLPGMDDDEPDHPWILVTLSGETILRVTENPWWFQRPPYLFGAIFRDHDYFYGHGLVEANEMWQYMINDITNQSVDSGTYSLNPITLMAPEAVDDPDMYQIEPMAKWLINPDAVKFDRPPPQMGQEGFSMVRFMLTVVESATGATAPIQGAPREGLGSSVSTATGMSQLTAAANATVIDQVDELEQQVFTPLLQMNEIAAHQFMDEKMVVRMMGPDGIMITDRVVEPEDLQLSSDIRWIASQRLREKLAKGQQLIGLLNILIGIPPEVSAQQGFRVRLDNVIRDAAIGIGVDNPSTYIEPIMTSIPGIPVELEVELADAGRKVEASPIEAPEIHAAKIQAIMALEMPNSELAKLRRLELIASHYAALQAQLAPPPGAEGQPTPGPQTPVPPQEVPAFGNEGAAMQGIGSILGGAMGTPGMGG